MGGDPLFTKIMFNDNNYIKHQIAILDIIDDQVLPINIGVYIIELNDRNNSDSDKKKYLLVEYDYNGIKLDDHNKYLVVMTKNNLNFLRNTIKKSTDYKNELEKYNKRTLMSNM